MDMKKYPGAMISPMGGGGMNPNFQLQMMMMDPKFNMN